MILLTIDSSWFVLIVVMTGVQLIYVGVWNFIVLILLGRLSDIAIKTWELSIASVDGGDCFTHIFDQ